MNKLIRVRLSSKIFSKDGIIKCLYWYSNDFKINIDLSEDLLFYNISLDPLHKVSLKKIKEIEVKLNREFIDYNLRDIVKKETTQIRELIIAKAFSNGEFDEEPKGDLMDPLGIKFL